MATKSDHLQSIHREYPRVDRDPTDVPDRCDECRAPTNDLCPLGSKALCTRCYRIAIADLPMPGPDLSNVSNDAMWEE